MRQINSGGDGSMGSLTWATQLDTLQMLLRTAVTAAICECGSYSQSEDSDLKQRLAELDSGGKLTEAGASVLCTRIHAIFDLVATAQSRNSAWPLRDIWAESHALPPLKSHIGKDLAEAAGIFEIILCERLQLLIQWFDYRVDSETNLSGCETTSDSKRFLQKPVFDQLVACLKVPKSATSGGSFVESIRIDDGTDGSNSDDDDDDDENDISARFYGEELQLLQGTKKQYVSGEANKLERSILKNLIALYSYHCPPHEMAGHWNTMVLSNPANRSNPFGECRLVSATVVSGLMEVAEQRDEHKQNLAPMKPELVVLSKFFRSTQGLDLPNPQSYGTSRTPTLPEAKVQTAYPISVLESVIPVELSLMSLPRDYVPPRPPAKRPASEETQRESGKKMRRGARCVSRFDKDGKQIQAGCGHVKHGTTFREYHPKHNRVTQCNVHVEVCAARAGGRDVERYSGRHCICVCVTRKSASRKSCCNRCLPGESSW
jgi:hypothetical protein